jgi:plasmid stabilization system protein ParE/Arc/MetJ-type ribon-helix-helix transcriptional regulator
LQEWWIGGSRRTRDLANLLRMPAYHLSCRTRQSDAAERGKSLAGGSLPWYSEAKETPNMAYQFPPDVERLVKDRMARGGYTSEDEVLRDALHALEEISYFRPDSNAGRITSFEALRREVRDGLEQLDLGQGRDADEVFEELLRDLPRPERDWGVMRVHFSPLAQSDLAEIKHYIAQDKPLAAARLIRALRNRIQETIASFPETGQACAGLASFSDRQLRDFLPGHRSPRDRPRLSWR